jgi:hypothetical protein
LLFPFLSGGIGDKGDKPFRNNPDPFEVDGRRGRWIEFLSICYVRSAKLMICAIRRRENEKEESKEKEVGKERENAYTYISIYIYIYIYI